MECCLLQGEVIRLNGGKSGVLLRCVGGTAWITCGDGVDYLIGTGGTFRVAPGQIAVAEAVEPVGCTMLRPEAEQSFERSPAIMFDVCRMQG